MHKPTQADMLRQVMQRARERHYRGEGEMWGYDSIAVRDAYHSGTYKKVLLSSEFCKAFFATPLQSQISPGTAPTIENAAEHPAAWERHHEALQSESDPIAYCWRALH